jgi:putative membrane protein
MMGYGPGYGHGYGYGNMMGGYGLGGLMAFLFGVLVIAGIVLLVIWAVRASHGHGNGAQTIVTQPPAAVGHDEAVAIAKRRLASGEITAEQYGEIMRTLGG